MRPALAVALLVVLAGCADEPKDDGPADAATETSGPAGTPAVQGTNSTSAPRWQVGDTWTWSVRSGATADVYEAVSVVLAADGTTYQVGTTDPTDAMTAYPFHLVNLGPVDAATLAWQAHGTPVQLIRFPLADGDRFTTDFWSAPGAEVEVTAGDVTTPRGSEPGFRTVARYAGADAVFMEADYSPRLGQFVRVATRFGGEEPFAEATLTQAAVNGTGQPFRVTDLARWTARADDPNTLAPRTFTVAADADQLFLACFITGQGAYTAGIAQRGGAVSCQGQGTDATSYAWAYTAAAEGTGSVTATPAGPGTLTTEAFAIDIGDG